VASAESKIPVNKKRRAGKLHVDCSFCRNIDLECWIRSGKSAI